MHRLRVWILNRRAKRIQNVIDELNIESITLTRYDMDIRFNDSDEPWTLDEFMMGSTTKKRLHKIFGNYTPGGLYD